MEKQFVYDCLMIKISFFTAFIILTKIIIFQEFLCIMPGLLYFVAIPSMSMLMFLYSIGNLHNVSLGTRETKQNTESDSPKKTHTPEKEETGYFCSLGNFVRWVYLICKFYLVLFCFISSSIFEWIFLFSNLFTFDTPKRHWLSKCTSSDFQKLTCKTIKFRLYLFVELIQKLRSSGTFRKIKINIFKRPEL